MIEVIVMILFSCFLLVVSAYFVNKPSITVEKRTMKETKKEELLVSVLERAKAFRLYENGGHGVNATALYREIATAKRIIGRKIARGAIVSDAEKWLYENSYLCYRYVYGNYDDMSDLPHVNGEPRIVLLCRIIVDQSLGDLNPERIRFLFNETKGIFTFTYRELRSFNNAMAFAVLEQIFILSQRLNYLNQCEKNAERGKYIPKFQHSDAFLYHLSNSENISKKTEVMFEKNGVNRQAITLSYNLTTLRNTRMAETLFGALRIKEEFLPIQIGLKYLSAYQILSKTNNFENVETKTLCEYFDRIEKISKKTNYSEEYVSQRVSEFCKKIDKDISVVLFDHIFSLIRYVRINTIPKKTRNTSLLEILYAWTVPLLGIGLSVGVFFLTKSIFFAIISFIPCFFIAENVLNYLLSHCKVGFLPPSMNYKSIRYENSVMVVISEYISDIKQFENSLFHAKTILEGNKDENLSVALLLDTKAGKTPISDIDEQIKEYIETHSLDDHLCLFLRKKMFQNGKFTGKERKRGAFLALCKYLVTKEEFDFWIVKNDIRNAPKYLVTLDADNMVLPGEILKMVNIISHPYNQKYDLLAMHSRNNLYSFKNRYSLRFIGESGFECYPNYSGLYYKLFKNDIYCGKGIVRLDRFYNKIDELFPSKKILSHDILEGSVLNTGSGGFCFEDVPENFISDRERRRRWQRGDIQLLPFLFGLWKNDEKELAKKNISPIGRYIMGRNILSVLKETCLFVLFLSGIVLSPLFSMVATVLFLIPYLINGLKIFRQRIIKKRFQTIVKESVANFFMMVEDFFTLGYYAVDNLIVFFSTFFKMIIKADLLEWKTYYSSQKKRELQAYIRELSIPTFTFTAIALTFLFLKINVLFFLLYILGEIFVFIGMYILSNQMILSKKVKIEEDILLDIANKTYKYFSFLRISNELLPDHLQVKPYKGEAKYTSPTNIGFNILAEICALYLNFISEEECFYNLQNIVSSIEKLPKWNGILYNWYDCKNSIPLNQFVSSVDNGNLLVALLICERFLQEKGEGVTALKLKFLINEFHIDKLYDKNKNLFYIGFDGKQYTGHYDLLASEARILSYVYIALFHDYAHYDCLQKDYMKAGGNVLLSWSGTMFEMLMADLFFSLPIRSALYQSSLYTVKKQIQNKTNGIWGVSESAYSEFNEEMRYKYKAFGLPDLALSNGVSGNVISPYSTFLAMRYAPEDAIKNIQVLSEKGMQFEYGFYESIDEQKEERIVYSVMSHHQGMILCAITNYLTNDILHQIVMSIPAFASVVQYCNDVQPSAKFIRRKKEKPIKYPVFAYNYNKFPKRIEQNYDSAGLTDMQYSVLCSCYGGGYSRFEKYLISSFSGEYGEENGMIFYAQDQNENWHSPTYFPCRNDLEEYKFGYSDKVISYSSDNGLKQEIALIPGMNGEVRRLSCSDRYQKCAFYFQVCLDEENDYRSHPCFRNLFVLVKQVSPSMIVVIKRFPGKLDKSICLAIRVDGMKNIHWECNKLNYIGRGRDLTKPLFLEHEDDGFTPSIGDVLYPCVGFKGDFTGEKKECIVTCCFDTEEKHIIQMLSSLQNNVFEYAVHARKEYTLRPLTQDIIGQLIFGTYNQVKIQNLSKEAKEFLSENLKNDRKIIRYYFEKKYQSNLLKIIEMMKDLQFFNLNIFLQIIINDDFDLFSEKYIKKCLYEKGISAYEIAKKERAGEDVCLLSIKSNLSFEKLKYYPNIVEKALNHLSNDKGEKEKIDFVFETGEGGYDSQGRYVVSGIPQMPYSNVVGGTKGGYVLTNEGDGFYYFGNSRENKIIRFDNDPLSMRKGENIFVKTDSGYFDVGGGVGDGYSFFVDKGFSLHRFCHNDFTSEVSHYMICDGEVKVLEANLLKRADGYFEWNYAFFPCLSWKYDRNMTYFLQNEDCICVTHILSNQKVYWKIIGIKTENLLPPKSWEPLPYFSYLVREKQENFYVLCSENPAMLHSICEENIMELKNASLRYYNMCKNIEIVSKEKSFDYLVNFLPYQILSSRLNAKAGFYQVGGATGFRDQLQDSLAFFTQPEIIKERIILACMHQYEAGDVMHWWHNEKFGLRTRITDDKLFLPFVVCMYIRYSGDRSILSEELPYLHSEPLSPEERDRFENPPYTKYTENIFSHCIKAIRSSLQFGEHNLLTMGTGDWNDGIDAIGSKGKGESVFNSMLCHWVLNEFAEYCPEELKKELYTLSIDLKKSINLFAFDGDRYKRLFSDDGCWMGSERSDVLKLDLLTQAFAVLSGVADGDRALACLTTAEKLIDKKAGLIRLLDPALNRKKYLGYISDYPKGIRENGGQYTHAAMWYLLALIQVGKQDEAFDLFQMMNPVEKCKDKEKSDRYMCEPYVLAGDVYSNVYHYGQGGWTWYTGSAGWAYKVVTEGFFGLKRRGDVLYIQPALPKKLDGSTVVYRYQNSTYIIEYRIGLVTQIVVRGETKTQIKLQDNVRENIMVESGY